MIYTQKYIHDLVSLQDYDDLDVNIIVDNLIQQNENPELGEEIICIGGDYNVW